MTGAVFVLSSYAEAISVAALGVSFVMMPFVLRTLGDHDYGLWVIAASFESYYYFLDLGLNLAASRYVSARLASGAMLARLVASCSNS